MDKDVTRTDTGLNSRSLLDFYGSERRHLPLMNLFSIGFGLTSIFVLVYYVVRAPAPYVIGQSLVSAEINLGILQLKPITLFMYLSFLSYTLGLSSPISKQRLLGIGEQKFESLYVVAWFMVLVSGFEVLYQIVLWSASLTVQGLQNPDIIVNWWPANPYAINVVFASKLIVLIFGVSCFSVDYMRRVRNTRERMRDRMLPVPGDRGTFRT